MSKYVSPILASCCSYITRFTRGLMQRDDWHNLGLDKVHGSESNSSPGTSTSVPSKEPPPTTLGGKR